MNKIKFIVVIMLLWAVVGATAPVLAAGGVEPVISGTTFQPVPNNCNVPISVMLHWYNADILAELLALIEDGGYTTTTYENWILLCPIGMVSDKTIILSFDDWGPNGIAPSLYWMVEYTNLRGHVGVIGVTGGNFDKAEWDLLRALHASGWEIANHTKSHNIQGLPALSTKEIYSEIFSIQNILLQEIGQSPTTLILPGGTYNGDTRIDAISSELGIQFIVGIASPVDPYIKGAGPHYVGRAGPWPESSPSGNATLSYALRIFEP